MFCFLTQIAQKRLLLQGVFWLTLVFFLLLLGLGLRVIFFICILRLLFLIYMLALSLINEPTLSLFDEILCNVQDISPVFRMDFWSFEFEVLQEMRNEVSLSFAASTRSN